MWTGTVRGPVVGTVPGPGWWVVDGRDTTSLERTTLRRIRQSVSNSISQSVNSQSVYQSVVNQ